MPAALLFYICLCLDKENDFLQAQCLDFMRLKKTITIEMFAN